ncbi:hypothetical protein OAF30_04160 [Flavobacteriales bacterium]|nr:hypothetical protein [Flavobacteriales bacterium]
MTDEQFNTYWAICENESHLRYPYCYDEPCAVSDMVLQPWIQQKVFDGTIDGKRFQDYSTGMMLCIEDGFSGLGQFRMTSAPVANFIKDDRKMAPWMTDNPKSYPKRYFEI